ncbi:hypothetical protein A4D02_29075 [Niastella koreensis]|uniref:Uncharacterized protein n=2 Tax=Niastella koreensis TaxID=354356 RepID=G8TRC6_NIAKG|nr:hypothetical protein [Niastella koreensis]AEW00048.1 hypothetical protein Niako_3752 [Niastella koreensis GR20-10]OQP49645.1 hypothetical protein A4D02_29075 [Niastella koreensis]
MNSNKRDEELKNSTAEDPQKDAKKTAFINGQSPESVKMNPNPRANENLSDKEKTTGDTTGAGSEITDGEDG